MQLKVFLVLSIMLSSANCLISMVPAEQKQLLSAQLEQQYNNAEKLFTQNQYEQAYKDFQKYL